MSKPPFLSTSIVTNSLLVTVPTSQCWKGYKIKISPMLIRELNNEIVIVVIQ